MEAAGIEPAHDSPRSATLGGALLAEALFQFGDIPQSRLLTM